MRSSKFITFLFVVFAIITFTEESAPINGGIGKPDHYVGQIQLGQNPGEECQFLIEIERILFRLNSVENKYKVVRIKINNQSGSILHLSREKDKIELYFPNNNTVLGILDLSNHDPAFWDAFEADMRRILAYPEVVKAGEEENIFVFIPDPKLKEPPMAFLYTIESLPEKEVIIRPHIVATTE
ncbi:MAG: hypothetical protein MN733_37535 [Nitrososphaera sp.]|nr:hypothetical protein [Nitrososphaera sp.]